jgi:hypothetical protein
MSSTFILNNNYGMLRRYVCVFPMLQWVSMTNNRLFHLYIHLILLWFILILYNIIKDIRTKTSSVYQLIAKFKV